MKADYVHKDTLTAIDYVDLQKENELIVSYNQQLLKEKKELKKQLHEASLKIQELIEQDIECPSNCSKLKKLKEEQQKFIKYLEDCIKELGKESPNKLQNVLNLGISDITKEVLQKYKKIVGDTNDKK